MIPISYDSGRTTWLFPIEEIYPLGGGMAPPRIIEAIASKYRFQHAPQQPTREDIEKNGLRFTNGVFQQGLGLLNIGEFSVFGDGMVAVSHTTEGADAFLIDVLEFLKAEFLFRPIISNVKKINLSTVVVEFEASLTALGGALEPEIETIGEALNSVEGTDFPLEISRIEFSLNKDPQFRPAHPPTLTIEKRTNSLSSQQRYYSVCQTPTKQHMEMLSQVERSLKRLMSR